MRAHGSRRWLLAGATAALLTACGAARAPAPRPSGRVLFGQACGACHSLSGVEDPRRQGGDLLHLHANRTQLRELSAEMPVRRPLAEAQLRAVVDYVLAVERRGHA
jgi:mono/diheme cytochrome c family protein